MRLSQLTTGETGVIIKILGHGAFRKRMIEMGFVRGQDIKVLMAARSKTPSNMKLWVMKCHCAVPKPTSWKWNPPSTACPTNPWPTNTVDDTCEQVTAIRHERHKVINIALIGNPNCGKTSLFSVASGAREHVGNYSGVTVDAKKGSFTHNGYRFNIVDLPGTYSLASYSPEELYVRRYLRDETPDVIINVVDGSNLERNLYSHHRAYRHGPLHGDSPQHV